MSEDLSILPALVVLITLKGLPFFGSHHASATTAVVDTLPPAWRPVSRLALENDFVQAALPEIVRARGGMKLTADPRTLRVSVDPETGMLSAEALVGTVPVGPPLRLGLDTYASSLGRENFRRIWQQRSIDAINSRVASETPTGFGTGNGLSFKLPSPLPKRVQSLLGPGGPAINVAGSENIKLSGQSNWTNQQIGLLGQKRSLFPTLDMQQDLDIRLEGQLSDRIKVNLLQNSANQVPLANRIFINYKGDEDDLVQELDLGNTSLSLPGTQYVSYSGKNEGLFGVKAALRLGPADFTMLASKQEGRSERATYTGGSSREGRSIADIDYIHGTYFFLFDPNRVPDWVPAALAPKFFGVEVDSVNLYLDDGDYTNDVNVQRGIALLDPESRDCTNPQDTTGVRGSYGLLQRGPDKDYEILRDVYGTSHSVIKLKQGLGERQRLAVSYVARAVDIAGNFLTDKVHIGGEIETHDCLGTGDTTTYLRLKLLRLPPTLLKSVTIGSGQQVYDTTFVFDRVRELELKNFYQLGGLQIDPGSFTLSIRQGVGQPPLIAINKNGVSVPYVEVLGLDSQNEGSGVPVPGHDGKVDGSIPFQSSRVLVDFPNGILFFPDPRPFAPRIVAPAARFFEQFVSDVLANGRPEAARRDSLVGADGTPNAANPLVYSRYEAAAGNQDQYIRYYIDVDYSAQLAVGEITLGRGNILEGSEVVTINGQQLRRDTDYSIDYDIGRLTLKRQLGPTDQLSINYSYAPLFAQAGRTLLGGDFRLEGREKRFGGALLYESRGAQDLRPRIGEEPSRTVIGDLNTEWTFHPDWVTRLVDRLPGVRTTAPSDFHFQAEMGASFPNPNTKGVVYIDDMESVRDAVSLSMTADRWRRSSVPTAVDPRDGQKKLMYDIPKQQNAEIDWYSPPNAVKERELNPSLTDAQGGGNSRQVLAFSLPRRPTLGSPRGSIDNSQFSPDTLWSGLTYVLDPNGLDLTRSQFIELWVDDFRDYHMPSHPEPRVRGRHVKLHIDLGTVSEDQMRSPDQRPNGTGSPDTEDRTVPPDGQLRVSEDAQNEDTGVDRAASPGKPGPVTENPDSIRDLVTAGANDPEGDDFHRVNDDKKLKEIDTRRFRGTNGTEDNHTLLPYPDTEDLNGNNHLDTNEDYFEYTIDLGDAASPYLTNSGGIDVFSKYGLTDAINGWRRYRIPITDSLRVAFGSPTLALSRHVRVWLEGVLATDPPEPDPADPAQDSLAVDGGVLRPFLMLGGFDIVGSRWQTSALDSASEASGTTITLNSVNNIDDPTYSPPFNPGDALNGNRSAVRREQSLVLEFENLRPGKSLEAYKSFSIDEDYSRYGSLTFYVSDFALSSVDTTLSYFVRFASDPLGQNYYEFRRRLSPTSPGKFESVDIPLTDLSNLKLKPDFPLLDPIHYSIAGPQAGDSLIVNGRPSFTRLRRISVGLVNDSLAATTVPHGQLWFDEIRAVHVAKDVGTAQRLQVDGKLANLFHYNLNYNNRDANFVTVGETRGTGSSQSQIGFNGGLDLNRFFEGTGILLPVTTSWTRNVSRPRFTAGDDVVRSGALQDASETRNDGKSVSVAYSRTWSDRANPLLRYSLGGITANSSYSESDGHDPTSITSGITRSSNVSWAVAPRNLLRIPLPFTRIGLFPLPERVFWNYTVASASSQTLDRQRDGSVTPRSNVASQAASIAFGADTRPVDLLHHHFDAVRNLRLPENLMEKVGFINFGRVTQWRQAFDSRYVMNKGPWLSPGFNWNSSYNQLNGPDLSSDLSVRQITNGQTVGLNWTLPFDRLARPRRAPGDSSKVHYGTAQIVKDALSRIGSVSADASFTQSSGYSRVVGTPNLLYLSGLQSAPGFTGEPGRGVQPAFGNTSSTGNDFRTSGRGRVALGFDAFVSTRAEYEKRINTGTNVTNRSVSTRFPDLDVEYGRISQVIGLKRFMESPQLRTSYTRSVQSDYNAASGGPYSRSTSSQWQPLLGLSGMMRNQTRVEMRVERRVSVRDNFLGTTSTTTDRNTDVNLNLSRSYSRGQKVTLLGKQATVRSNVNLQLALAYSKQSGEIKQFGSPDPIRPTDTDRLSVNGSGSYSFSNNVTGNLGIGFGQQRNLVTANTSRNIRLELRAAFTF